MPKHFPSYTYLAEANPFRCRAHPSPRGSVHTLGQYVKNPVDKLCSPETLITTLEECRKAKLALAPDNYLEVVSEQGLNFPGGCSIWRGKFFFNFVLEGKADGVSIPVCKVTPAAAPTTTAASTTTRASITTPAPMTTLAPTTMPTSSYFDLRLSSC